jgi:hypothetical protein
MTGLETLGRCAGSLGTLTNSGPITRIIIRSRPETPHSVAHSERRWRMCLYATTHPLSSSYQLARLTILCHRTWIWVHEATPGPYGASGSDWHWMGTRLTHGHGDARAGVTSGILNYYAWPGPFILRSDDSSHRPIGDETKGPGKKWKRSALKK